MKGKVKLEFEFDCSPPELALALMAIQNNTRLKYTGKAEYDIEEVEK